MVSLTSFVFSFKLFCYCANPIVKENKLDNVPELEVTFRPKSKGQVPYCTNPECGCRSSQEAVCGDPADGLTVRACCDSTECMTRVAQGARQDQAKWLNASGGIRR